MCEVSQALVRFKHSVWNNTESCGIAESESTDYFIFTLHLEKREESEEEQIQHRGDKEKIRHKVLDCCSMAHTHNSLLLSIFIPIVKFYKFSKLFLKFLAWHLHPS